MKGMVLLDPQILAGFDLYFPDSSYFELQFSALCVTPFALLNVLL